MRLPDKEAFRPKNQRLSDNFYVARRSGRKGPCARNPCEATLQTTLVGQGDGRACPRDLSVRCYSHGQPSLATNTRILGNASSVALADRIRFGQDEPSYVDHPLSHWFVEILEA